ncbi:alpha/beta fold hydrolase [Actinacidiphila oryziradicis]|jgi:pimeloyl-ACP methyl ester carboxylesterase|uniref:alpha/beta fold hydrolase n=1 Tax=Actinacidiphila oryziradicis TaxID=2571141 RepID=UPI0023F250E2|nr:alpha/beta fold hydrolase [Actinacidiphila oryziradicis]MCW2875691.1 Pimeloyl-ACP methyl ester carboxylesterase [Actinacidiphila oryziradicis]
MPVVTSADGTAIAYERTGSGPALVLVDGAMCYRAAGPMQPLAALLQDNFSVYTYDRRGRGESSDTTPYAVAREVEDLQALIAQAGGEAYVYAISSGVALALATAAAGPWITKLALYEPPFMAEVGDSARIKEYTERLSELLDAGRRGDAVALFMTNVGIPAEAVAGIRAQPGWAALEALAPTLAYDDEVLGDGSVPRDLASTIAVPALVLGGGASPQSLQQAAKATADSLPAAEHRTLDGQTHDVAPDVLTPVLVEFFGA